MVARVTRIQFALNFPRILFALNFLKSLIFISYCCDVADTGSQVRQKTLLLSWTIYRASCRRRTFRLLQTKTQPLPMCSKNVPNRLRKSLMMLILLTGCKTGVDTLPSASAGSKYMRTCPHSHTTNCYHEDGGSICFGNDCNSAQIHTV
jgi:hypothetical protein